MIKKLLRVNYHYITSSRNDDTIYALATGVNTAISIVRVGGQSAYRALQLLQKTHKNSNLSAINQKIRQHYLKQHKIQSHRAHYKTIYNSEGNVLDQCLLLYFPPGHSYNNEQIIQFHVHGSKAIITSLFKQFKQKGFRMADRGQFTKRALLNDKFNLMQAQSINDLIRSESEFQRQIAIDNMLGKSKDFLESVKKQLVKCLVNNQAFIDFQEDQVKKDVRDDLFTSNQQKVKQLIKKFEKILQNYKNLQILKQGINLTIIGKPNAGKSTLINALAQKQVAIVSDQPGTTRDVLQTQIQCGGIMLNLYDTAGLRDTSNKIQVQGIRRAKMRIKQSQINLLIIDLDHEQLKEHTDQNGKVRVQIVNKYFQNLSKDNKKINKDIQKKQQTFNYNQLIDQNTILIINKSDKLPPHKKQDLNYFIKINKKIQNSDSSQLSDNFLKTQHEEQQQYKIQQIPISLIISAQNTEQVNKLLNFLQGQLQLKYSLYKTSQQIYFTRERYFVKLSKCVQYLQKYTQESRPDIACEYLRVSISEISQIFGKVDVEDMLDVLFAQFCIGK